MKLNAFAILADENVKPSLVVYLREKGFDVLSVQEEKLFGTTDELILALANKKGRIIITQDDDFAQIVFTQKTPFIGIIHLKPGHFSGDIHIQTLNAILTLNPDVDIPFIISAVNNGSKTKIKVRHFPSF
jgi:predicted nuclease of predicted toxin-antitoxin system